MTQSMNGRRRAVLVTGASTGIGQAIALYLDQLGYRVFGGVRKQADGEELQRSASNHLQWVYLDVVDQDSVRQAFELIQSQVGEAGLAGLVNNAGIAVASPLEFIPLEEFRRQLEVNVVGQLQVTQAFLPLVRQAGGRLVFIGSISGRVTTPLLGPYSASKFAMTAVADALHRELMPWGIHVAVVEPGRIATPIWSKSIRSAQELRSRLPEGAEQLYGAAMDKVERRAASKKGGTPVEEVTGAVAHALASPRPKRRYLIGRDARMGALMARLLPASILDYLIVSQRGLRKK
jgi:NAD(P)-dependent dehydrogenase (short-subunit alcohol dehydrogenase family)